MRSQIRSKYSIAQRLLFYLLIGLLADIAFIAFFALYDLFEGLNRSSESIFKIQPSWITHILLPYLSIYLPTGVLITLFLLFIYFAYQKELFIKSFMLTKADFLVVLWFLLMFPLMFGFYGPKFLGNAIKEKDRLAVFYTNIFYATLLCCMALLVLSLLALYFKRKEIQFPLYTFRSLLVLLIFFVFLSSGMETVKISRSIAMEESGTLHQTEQQDIKDFNILLIAIDTCRADKLSCYHFGKKTSPHIDALSAKSFVFDYAFSASNSTKRATASLFTSFYPGKHQTGSLDQKLPKALLTLPERFKQASYHTAVFAANGNICREFGFDQGVDFFFETWGKETVVRYPGIQAALSRLSLIPLLGGKFQSFLKQKAIFENATEEDAISASFFQWLRRIQYEKFFAYLHFNTPHTEYTPPPEFDIFADDYTVKVSRVKHYVRKPRPERIWKRIVALYYGEILYVDFVIGNIIDTMEKRGLSDRSIIVITADHGEEFYDHNSWGHGHTMYKELIHIPFILYIPHFSYPPSRIQHYVSNMDIGPTLLSLTGQPVEDLVDGKDLSPLLQGDTEEIHDFIFAEDGITQAAIIRGPYKYVQGGGETITFEKLYNIQKDFKEQNEIPLDSTEASIELKELMAAIKRDIASNQIESESIVLSEKKKEQLKALGYIE